MTVAHHLRVFDAALRVDPVAHRAVALDALVQGAFGVIRRVLGDRQVLATGGRGGLGLAGAFGGCGSGAGLGLLCLLAGQFLGRTALAFNALALGLFAFQALTLALLLDALARQGGLLQLLLFDAWVGPGCLYRLGRLGLGQHHGRQHGLGLWRGRRRQGDQARGQRLHLRCGWRVGLPVAEQQREHQGVQAHRHAGGDKAAPAVAGQRYEHQGRRARHGQRAHCGASVIRPRLLTPPFCSAAMPARTVA